MYACYYFTVGKSIRNYLKIFLFLFLKGDLNLKETECQEVASCLEEALSKTNDLKEEVPFDIILIFDPQFFP